ncbi:MAG: hypothetical protein WKH64_15530 [Chloroflexia bacterium]
MPQCAARGLRRGVEPDTSPDPGSGNAAPTNAAGARLRRRPHRRRTRRTTTTPQRRRAATSGKVTFSVFGDPAEKAAYDGLAAAFEKKYPRIDVQLIHIPDQADYRKRLATDFAANTPASSY